MEWSDDEEDIDWLSAKVKLDITWETADSETENGPDYLTDSDIDTDSEMDFIEEPDYGPYYITTKYNGIREQHKGSPSTSIEVNTSLSDRAHYDENDVMEWLSTSNTSTSLVAPKSPQCEYTTWLPGSMAKLPLELVFNIFDLILLDTPRLSHGGLHSLLAFGKASKHTGEMVDCYMRSDHIRQQLIDWKSPDCVKWYRSRAEAYHATRDKARAAGEKPPLDCDLLTEVIVDDCPDCYKWLGRKIPGFSQAPCAFNEYGWRFLAIAIRSGSYKILQHLFKRKSCEPPARLLDDEADTVGFSETTCLGMLAYQKDPIFAEKLLDLIGPLIQRDLPNGWIVDVFSTKEKILLCKFITARTAEWLTSLGVRLWRVGTAGPRPENIIPEFPDVMVRNYAWNAAARNAPELLEFLYKYDPDGISRSGHGNIKPIFYAAWFDKADTFRWLLRKMIELNIDYLSDESASFNGATRIDLAVAKQTSPASEIMLEDILAAPKPDEHNYHLAGQFFKEIVLGCQKAGRDLAARSDLGLDSYKDIMFEHEQRAVRKAKAVSKVYFDTGLPMPVLTKADANAHHADAINLAKTLGFGELENVFDSYSAI